LSIFLVESFHPHNSKAPARQGSDAGEAVSRPLAKAIVVPLKTAGLAETVPSCHCSWPGRVRKEAAREPPLYRHFLLVIFFCAIIFLVNRSPSTVSW
jgi:hypothetical protein